MSNPPGPAKLFIYAPSEAVISIDNDRMPRNPKPFRVANLMITEPAGCQVEVSARIEKTDWTWRRSIHVLPGEHVVVKIPSRVAASPFEPLRFSATLPVPPPGQIDLLPAATMITTTTSVGEGHDDSSSAPRGETPSAPAAHDPFELPAPHPETPEVLMGGAYPGEELWLQTHKIQVNSSPGIFVPPADTLPLLMYRYQPRVPRLSINNVWPKRAEIQLRVELKVTVGNGKQILLPRIATHVNLTDDVLSGQRLLNPQIEQRVLAAIAQAISEEQGPYRLGGIVVLGQRIHELAPKPIFPMESAD